LWRYRGKVSRLYFRPDAAFANPEVHEYLKAEGFKYAIRLPATSVLQERIGYLLKHPADRPPFEVRRCNARFSYRAQSWKMGASRPGRGQRRNGGFLRVSDPRQSANCRRSVTSI
jgi:hypothetical protein